MTDQLVERRQRVGSPETLSVRETAERLGLHPNTIYRLAALGGLPSIKVGGSVLIPRARLEEMLSGRPEMVPAAEEPWRRALWLGHGCPLNHLYCDDGEMQCPICRIDFKRDSIQRIREEWYRQASRAVLEGRQ